MQMLSHYFTESNLEEEISRIRRRVAHPRRYRQDRQLSVIVDLLTAAMEDYQARGDYPTADRLLDARENVLIVAIGTSRGRR